MASILLPLLVSMRTRRRTFFSTITGSSLRESSMTSEERSELGRNSARKEHAKWGRGFRLRTSLMESSESQNCGQVYKYPSMCQIDKSSTFVKEPPEKLAPGSTMKENSLLTCVTLARAQPEGAWSVAGTAT